MNENDTKVMNAEVATDVPRDVLEAKPVDLNSKQAGDKAEGDFSDKLSQAANNVKENVKENIKETAEKIEEKGKEALDKVSDALNSEKDPETAPVKAADSAASGSSLVKSAAAAEADSAAGAANEVSGGISVQGSLNMGNKALAGFLKNSVFSAPGIVFADSDSLAPLKNIKKDLLPAKGYKFDLQDNQVAIDLFVYALFGTNIPESFEIIKKELETSLEKMLGIKITKINMEVLDLLVKEEYEMVKGPRD